MGRGEEGGDRAGIVGTDDHCLFRSHRVEHRERVLDPLLERRRRSRRDRIGQSDATTIAANQPTERRQAPIRMRQPGLLLPGVGRDEVCYQKQDVDRAITKNLVRDVNVAALCITGPRRVRHGRQSAPILKPQTKGNVGLQRSLGWNNVAEFIGRDGRG